MATKQSSTDPDNTKAMTKSLHEDDFVVLKNFESLTDSGMSTTSSIPEKQAFESLEKPSGDSLLEGSSIDEKPFYEDNIFLDAQHKAINKLYGESAGNDSEKNDTVQEKNVHVEELPSPAESGGSKVGDGTGFAPPDQRPEKENSKDTGFNNNGQVDSVEEEQNIGTEAASAVIESSKRTRQGADVGGVEDDDAETADANVIPENNEERIEDSPASRENRYIENEPREQNPTLRRRVPRVEPQEREQPNVAEGREVARPVTGSVRWFIFALVVVVLLVIVVPPPPPDKRSPAKPVITINTQKHLPPDLPSLWKLSGSCRAYNASYTIALCEWKQIHPLPTNPDNTVLHGDSNCLHGKSFDTIDATISDLKVPKERGNYVFQLRCSDNTENANELRVDIWVNELVPPVITLPENDNVISTSVGLFRLEGSCRASQGTIASERWDFISGLVDIPTPVEGGYVKFDTPGKYRFQYKCTDCYNAKSLQYVDLTVKPSYVLGIDLGTSTTCVVVIKENGTSEDIPIYDKNDPNDLDPCMPSVVAFSRDGRLLVGEKAARQAVENPASTIYEVKRLMGRSYYDDKNHTFSYRVRPTLKSHSLKGVRAAIEIPCNGTNRLIPPELVSALILRHVVDVAQAHLGVDVKDVVISVPAQFDDAQRKATKDAGLIAGLNPIKIVNEPTVAAFASRNLMQSLIDIKNGVDAKNRETVMAVVADIGGGTTDYALMQIQGTAYKVLTTDGDKTLGGRDIDILLAQKLTKIFAKQQPGLDLRNKKFQQKLRIACETAKMVLSEKHQYSITVDYTDEDQVEPLPLQHMLTRVEFEGYISGILEAMIKPLEPLMYRSAPGGMHQENVEELYLVGGTSNIPKLKQLLGDYFKNVTDPYHKDPVQLVSRGAAAFGAVLTHLVEIPTMPSVDVTPLPISIAIDMGDMHVIFARNRVYPCIEYLKVSTFADSQTAIMIKVYEGDGPTEDKCHFLGEFELSGIPALPKGVPEINTIFRIDSNGILSVKATHGETETGMKLDVYSKSGSMTGKTRDDRTRILTELMLPKPSDQFKCSLLDIASPMVVIPPKVRAENVLKLSVDSEYESVQLVDVSNPAADLPAIGMVAVKGAVTDYDSSVKESDLDIVLVIDESGSMDGIPIDTIKDVIERIIDILKDNHRLGIVTYDSSVYRRMELTYCTDESKKTAHDIVRRISASGQTNLYGGLLAGLQMAYHGTRRSSVLLFTDGYANVGVVDVNEIIREIVKQTASLSGFTSARVTLSTFGYRGSHDEFLLSNLASNVGDGKYSYLSENSALAEGFGHVLGDAINTVAEKIQLVVTPLSGVQIVKAITNFTYTAKADGRITFEIPTTANQQARHVLLRLAVPPCQTTTPHDNLFSVELTYTNTITEREEGSDEYLFVARTRRLDIETRSQEVDKQMNRVFVADTIGQALEHLKNGNKEEAINLLVEAEVSVSNSISRKHTLSLCLRNDLEELIGQVKGDLNEAKKFLQDSLTSHWQEKGGKGSCYLTKKEEKLITILKN